MDKPVQDLQPEDEALNKYATLNEATAEVNLEQLEEDLSYIRSNKTWSGLKVPERLEARLIQLGFKAPSKIQARVLPLSKKNSVFAQSQNGSGKTLAFLLPSLLSVDLQMPTSKVEEVSGSAKIILLPQVIVLADTRPLIGQIVKIAETIGESVLEGLRVQGLFSQSNPNPNGCHIMVTTIVYLRNMFSKHKNISAENLKILVVDEADKVMKSDISTTFLPQLVVKVAPPDMRLILTTATSTSISKNFVEKIHEKKRIVKLELEVDKLTLKNVQQLYIECNVDSRFEILQKVISEISAQNILIFANSKRMLTELAGRLAGQGHKVAVVSSNTSKNIAEEAEKNNQAIVDFLAGKYRVLISTDLLSRGVDMRKVTLVVNLELPKYYADSFMLQQRQNDEGAVFQSEADVETYLHRVGRTGRYGDRGVALNFVTNDQQKQIHDQIVDFYKMEMTQITVEDLQTLESKLAQVNTINTVKRDQLEENI